MQQNYNNSQQEKLTIEKTFDEFKVVTKQKQTELENSILKLTDELKDSTEKLIEFNTKLEEANNKIKINEADLEKSKAEINLLNEIVSNEKSKYNQLETSVIN